MYFGGPAHVTLLFTTPQALGILSTYTCQIDLLLLLPIQGPKSCKNSSVWVQGEAFARDASISHLPIGP